MRKFASIFTQHVQMNENISHMGILVVSFKNMIKLSLWILQLINHLKEQIEDSTEPQHLNKNIKY